jgi:hypothetical protein
MENLEFILRATQAIVENCTEAKLSFCKKVTSFFEEHKHLNKTIISLPLKRTSSLSSSTPSKVTLNKNGQPRKARKSSSKSKTIIDHLSSDSEKTYTENSFSKLSKFTNNSEKLLNDELKEIFSSDDCSLFNSDSEETSSTVLHFSDLESIHESLSTNSNPSNILDKLGDFLEHFPRLPKEEVLLSQILLKKISQSTLNRPKERVSKKLSKIQEKIAEVTKK